MQRVRPAFPLMMTSAGTVAPAKVLVIERELLDYRLLQLLKDLGLLFAFDVRSYEAGRNLGAKFVDVASNDSETAAGYAKEMTAAQRNKMLF